MQSKGCSNTKRWLWWWTDAADIAVREKLPKWKQWKQGRSKEEYKVAKKNAYCTVYNAKQQAQSEYSQDINTENDQNKIFKMVWTTKGTSKVVQKQMWW